MAVEHWGLRLAEVFHDVADGLGREELGVAALVTGCKGVGEGRTTADPGVETVEGYVRSAVGEVEHGELGLGITLDGHGGVFWGVKGEFDFGELKGS